MNIRKNEHFILALKEISQPFYYRKKYKNLSYQFGVFGSYTYWYYFRYLRKNVKKAHV